MTTLSRIPSFRAPFKKHTLLSGSLVALGLALLSFGCGGGGSTTPPPPPVVGVTIIPHTYANTTLDRAQNYFTGGVGIRTKSFFVDAAGIYLKYNELHSPYSLATDDPATGFKSVANGVSPVVNVDSKRVTVRVTGGLFF